MKRLFSIPLWVLVSFLGLNLSISSSIFCMSTASTVFVEKPKTEEAAKAKVKQKVLGKQKKDAEVGEEKEPKKLQPETVSVTEKQKTEEAPAQSTPSQQTTSQKVTGKTEGVREEKCAFKNYCINFMWINRSLDKTQQYIYPTAALEKKEEKRAKAMQEEFEGRFGIQWSPPPRTNFLQKNFLSPIYEWAEKHKGSVVNVWYDGELTSKEAVENTRKLISEYSEKHPDLATIKLRDVRDLPLVKKHPQIFSDKVPVYFRVDLLRVIIACYLLRTGETDCFIYADLDIEKALSKEALFDPETVQNLQEFGIVLARGGILGFENGFQMITNNKNLLEAMEWALIELNIQRAYNVLNGKFYDYEKSINKLLPQIIYDSYPSMFKYFYHLEKCGVLLAIRWVTDKDGSVVKEYTELYDKERDGLEPFNSKAKPFHENLSFSYSEDFKKVIKSKEDYASWRLYVPTKKVDLPPASLNYNE